MAERAAIRIIEDDVTHPDVIDLLEYHLAQAHANSPPGSVFALDLAGLRAPETILWSAWEGDILLGLAALKHLDAAHGEVKSMRTAPAQLRRGIAARMLEHVIAEARKRGIARLSLETGNHEPFAAARALYRRMGFVPCGPFAGYSDESFSTYFTLAL